MKSVSPTVSLTSRWPATVKHDATDTWAVFVDCYSDVAFFSPPHRPRVPDDPILCVSFLSVANSSNCMINVCGSVWAFDRVNDAFLIELEVVIAGGNTNASWTRLNRFLKSIDTLGYNLFIICHFHLSFGLDVLAFSIFFNVGIV